MYELLAKNSYFHVSVSSSTKKKKKKHNPDFRKLENKI